MVTGGAGTGAATGAGAGAAAGTGTGTATGAATGLVGSETPADAAKAGNPEVVKAKDPVPPMSMLVSSTGTSSPLVLGGTSGSLAPAGATDTRDEAPTTMNASTAMSNRRMVRFSFLSGTHEFGTSEKRRSRQCAPGTVSGDVWRAMEARRCAVGGACPPPPTRMNVRSILRWAIAVVDRLSEFWCRL